MAVCIIPKYSVRFKDGSLRSVGDQDMIALALEWFGVPSDVAVTERMLMKLRDSREEAMKAFNDKTILELNDFHFRVLLATCHGKRFREVDIYPR